MPGNDADISWRTTSSALWLLAGAGSACVALAAFAKGADTVGTGAGDWSFGGSNAAEVAAMAATEWCPDRRPRA